MPEVTIDKAVCAECGVDVRENTMFCYNCGSSVSDIAGERMGERNGGESDQDSETQAALKELAEKLKIDDDADNKLARAAAERKKARQSQRRSNEFTWEPADDSSSRFFVLLAVLIAVISAGVVFVTVFWR